MDTTQETENTTLPENQGDLVSKVIEFLTDSIAEKITVRISAPDTSQVESMCKKTAYSVEAMSKQFETLGATNQLLENTNYMNRKLSDQHYDSHIIFPMIRSLLPVMDLINDTTEKLRQQGVSNRHTSVKNLLAIRTQLSQFLTGFGISSFSHEQMDKFDPKTMKPLKMIKTKDSDLKNLVAESLQCGFSLGEKILRMETVSLFKS